MQGIPRTPTRGYPTIHGGRSPHGRPLWASGVGVRCGLPLWASIVGVHCGLVTKLFR